MIIEKRKKLNVHNCIVVADCLGEPRKRARSSRRRKYFPVERRIAKNAKDGDPRTSDEIERIDFIFAARSVCFSFLCLRCGSRVVRELFLWTLRIPANEICINHARVKDKFASVPVSLRFLQAFVARRSNFFRNKTKRKGKIA